MAEESRNATRLFAALAAVALTAAVASGAQRASASEATVIALTQIPCQFVESENGVDHGFTTTRKADCDTINARTGAERLATAKVLELKPGKYVFRVVNKNVPYDLGFWLRGKGLGRITLPSVSGGGLSMGVTRDYVIDLKEGEYLYSCPLNTTPDYRLVVKG